MRKARTTTTYESGEAATNKIGPSNKVKGVKEVGPMGSSCWIQKPWQCKPVMRRKTKEKDDGCGKMGLSYAEDTRRVGNDST